MKIFKYIISALLITFMLLSVSGCSKDKKTKENILADLSAAGFENEISNTFKSLSELEGTAEYDMSLEITETEETDTENIYSCTLICSNSDYEITYDMSVIYTKAKEVTYSTHSINDTISVLKKSLPKSKIVEDINKYFEEQKKVVEIDEKSLEQEIAENEFGYNATVLATVTEGILSKPGTVTVNYVFSGKWNTYVEYTSDSYSWNIDALAEKKWTDTSDIGKGDYIQITETDSKKEIISVCYKKGDKQLSNPTPFTYTSDGKVLKVKTDDFSFEISPDMSIIMSGNKVLPQ